MIASIGRSLRTLVKRFGTLTIMMVPACGGGEVSGGPDRLSLRLPVVEVSLNPESPEIRVGFRVGSDDGRYILSADLVTKEEIYPSLEMRSLAPLSVAGSLSPLTAGGDSPRDAHLRTVANLICRQDQFPCIQDFEIIATGALTDTSSASGTLTISVLFRESFHENAYLQIEPL